MAGVELNIKTKLDISKAKEGTKEIEKGAKKAGGAIDQMTGAIDKFTGGAITAFKSFGAGVKSGIASLRTFKGLLATTGIGAVVIAVASLFSYFTKTERGAEALRVVMATLEGVLGAVTDKVISLGEGLFNAISNPKQAIEDLGNQFVYYFTEFIPNAIQKVIDGLGLLGKSISLLFEGEFSKAAETAAEGFVKVVDGATDLNPVTAIVKSVTEEVIELGKEAIITAEKSGALERRLNALRNAERDLAVETAKRRAEIKELNKDAEDTTKTYKERAEAARKASQLESSLLNERVRLAKENVAIIREQNALSESSEADIQKLADAEIALANIREQSLELQTTLQNKLNILDQQRKAENKADTENERLEKLKEEDNAIREYKLENDEVLLEDLLIFEQRKRDLELEQLDLTEAEKEAIRLSYLEKEAAAKKQISDKVAADNKKKDKDDLALAKANADAKTSLLGKVFQIGAMLGEKNVAIGKGLAVAQAGINTYQGVTAALAQTTDATPTQSLRFANAAAVGIMGALNVKKILSTNPSGGSAPNPSTSAGGGVSSTPPPVDVPSFDFINQGVGGTQNAGFNNRAYVVNQDIRDQSALDERIRDLSRA